MLDATGEWLHGRVLRHRRAALGRARRASRPSWDRTRRAPRKAGISRGSSRGGSSENEPPRDGGAAARRGARGRARRGRARHAAELSAGLTLGRHGRGLRGAACTLEAAATDATDDAPDDARASGAADGHRGRPRARESEIATEQSDAPGTTLRLPDEPRVLYFERQLDLGGVPLDEVGRARAAAHADAWRRHARPGARAPPRTAPRRAASARRLLPARRARGARGAARRLASTSSGDAQGLRRLPLRERQGDGRACSRPSLRARARGARRRRARRPRPRRAHTREKLSLWAPELDAAAFDLDFIDARTPRASPRPAPCTRSPAASARSRRCAPARARRGQPGRACSRPPPPFPEPQR